VTLLARTPGRLVTYRAISYQLWGGRKQADLPAVRTSVSPLPRELGVFDGAPSVLTEPHVRYRLVPANA